MTASADSHVALYDVRQNKSVSRFDTGHGGRVYWAEYSPKGNLLATCGTDAKIRLWDVNPKEKYKIATKKPLVIEGHNGAIHQCMFNSENNLIVSTSCEEEIAVHNLKGEMISIYKLPKTTPEGELSEKSKDSCNIKYVEPWPKPVWACKWFCTEKNKNTFLSASFDGTIHRLQLLNGKICPNEI